MSNILSQRWLLSRRHFLRGVGATMALPLARCDDAAARRRRGRRQAAPQRVRLHSQRRERHDLAGDESRARLRAFAVACSRWRSIATTSPIFSGLHHPNGLGQAHVCADTWLTGAKIDAQSARQYQNTISCDQLMAEVTSQQTRFASLELSISSGTGQPNNSTHAGLLARRRAAAGRGQSAQRLQPPLRRGAGRHRRPARRPRTSAAACSTRCSTTRSRCAATSAPTTAPSSTNTCTPCATWSSAPSGSTPGSTCPSRRSMAAPFQRNVSKAQAGEYYRTMYRPDRARAAHRHDARRHLHERQRRQRPGHPRDRHHADAPRALASQRRPRGARPPGQERRLHHAAVRPFPRPAAEP